MISSWENSSFYYTDTHDTFPLKFRCELSRHPAPVAQPLALGNQGGRTGLCHVTGPGVERLGRAIELLNLVAERHLVLTARY